jgi:hypothetical protein
MTLSSDLPLLGINSRVTIPFPHLVGRNPFNMAFTPILGRLWKFTATAPTAFRLYSVKLLARVLGSHVDYYETTGPVNQAMPRAWDSMPVDLGNDALKVWDAIRFELETDGASSVAFSTDLPGEAMTQRYTQSVTQAAKARSWATVPVPSGIEGRLGRVILTGAPGFQFNVYKMQVRARAVGRYISAQNGPNAADAFRTRMFEFGTERLKIFKKISVNVQNDGPVTVNIYTDANTSIPQASFSITTTGVNEIYTLVLPFNTQGRLLSVEVISTSPCRLYQIRAWTRPLNELGAPFSWSSYPLDESAVIDRWIDLPVPEMPGNSDTWQWITVPGIDISGGE